ncbi:MAG TPA: pentapeptide repeat-containing protein [Candidatus Dorea merdavium]|nr:pentapeptide repeat-containing protein [Candidatus Dorea merdavium]
MRYRYLSKSILSSCKGDGESFEFINFRGSHFSKSTFKNASFKGCDFWGTTFKKCKFNEAVFQDCVFQGCKFDKCDFTGAKIQYSAIVNTNTDECKDLFVDNTSITLKKYPDLVVPEVIAMSIEALKDNKDLRRTKVFWISDKKANILKKYNEIIRANANEFVIHPDMVLVSESK